MAAQPRNDVAVFLDEIKFSHSIFALPFAAMALVMAAGWPSWGQLVLIVCCMVTARTFAMTANRLVDREIDAANPRTARRAWAGGRLSLPFGRAALLLSGGLFVLACGGFWLWDVSTPTTIGGANNPWPLICAIPLLALLVLYSYLKRFTAWCHLYLGAVIACAPVATWVAVSPGNIGWPVILLMVAVAMWIAGFDIIYSLQDYTFDSSAGLHSLPVWVGPAHALTISRLMHVGTVLTLSLLGVTFGFGWWYAAGVLLTAALLTIEQSLVSPTDLSRVNLAFFTINGCVSLAMAALGVIDILQRSGAS